MKTRFREGKATRLTCSTNMQERASRSLRGFDGELEAYGFGDGD
jgi:hypothetical protein